MPKPFCPRLRRADLTRIALILPLLLLACGSVGEEGTRTDVAPTSATAADGGVAERSTRRGAGETVRRESDLPSGWLEVAIFEATNERRRRHGRETLRREDRLAEIARLHSRAMLERGFFDHVDPDGASPAQRVARQHRTLVGISGENLWTGTGFRVRDRDEAQEVADMIVDGWMDSPGHRENILKPDFDHLGVGVEIRGRELRATQVFASVVAWLDAPLQERLRQGDELRIRATAASGREQPVLWDLAPVEGGEAFGPWQMSESVELDDRALEDGERYQLRLFELVEVDGLRRRYEVFSGPEVVVD